MAIVDLDGRFLQVNRELCRVLDRTEDQLLREGCDLRQVSADNDLEALRADFRRLATGAVERSRRDHRYVRPDGTILWGATTLALVRDADGRPQYAIGQLEDITARRAAEERAERRAAQQAALARLSQLALSEQHVPALASATVASIVAILAVPEAETRSAVDALLERGRAIAEDDTPFGVLARCAGRAVDGDDLAFLQAVANVLTAAARRIAAEHGLRHQSLHDPLTQLPNRALLVDRLRLALARARRERHWTAVLYLDVDDFKNVNDSLGHGAGDQLLRDLAPRLSEVLRPSDTLARLGGDEFAILCEGLDEAAESGAIAERLLAAAQRPLALGTVELRPGASVGIALVGPGTVADGDDVLRDAGVAMYRAKGAGRGRYELFDDGMRAETLERVALTNDLRRAIEDGGLRLVYQPVVQFSHRRVSAFEALVRWTHPERGEIPPSRFIPLAEQHGLIGALGSWVLREALDQQRRWRDAGLALGEMSMSVNVSRVQLSRPDLAGEVLSALAERGLSPEHLMLEVTESAVMEDPDVAHATLRALGRAGVRIALDDFGVGQSSLACLRDLPLDVLKLDRGFIISLATSREAVAIVRAVTDMARTLGFSVVAEGIETAAQGQVVEALGCDIGQGFLYARPVAPDEAPGTVLALDLALSGGLAGAHVS